MNVNRSRRMRKRRKVRPLLMITLFAGGLAVTDNVQADPELSPDELKLQVERTYPVKVLRIRAFEVDDKVAYAVTVMTHGGNFNGAFQVNTFIVDADTGVPISVFRHLNSGYVLPDGGDRDTNLQPADAARAGFTWR